MALVERGVGAQAVEVPPAFDIVDPRPLGARDHDRQRVVVVRPSLPFEIE